ncbi:MAG: membrane-bound lytic murein transglycosylase MltF [Betaproteobacteria bacterium]
MRLSRRIAFVAAGLAVTGTVAYVLVHTPTLTPVLHTPDREGEVVLMVRPGPGTYFPGPDGEASGFDADLARLFAAERRLPLRIVTANTPTELLGDLAAGDAHIGAGGLYRPLATRSPPARPAAVAAAAAASATTAPPDEDPASRVLWTSGYFPVEPVVIYNADGFKPAGWKDLEGEAVAYIADTGLDSQIAAVRTAHPEVTWEALRLSSAAALIAQVSDGRSNYAVVASSEASVARNIYLFYDVAFPAGGKREFAWAVSPKFAALRDELDVFFARLKRDGTLDRLAERYFTHTRQVQRIDAAVLQERIRSMLPKYRALFQDAQAATGIEWRLLAAVSYQESQWDPDATSETGVRGLMQLTEDTARHLGVLDRLDPKQSVLAAARYLIDLKDKLPARIKEPDRTWLALAAFNIGIGHLEDARVLAQKQKLNPDLWGDVKKALPLLALPEYHEDAKNGYARGGMPVVFVDRVRAYYDVLLAHQPAAAPRLRLMAGVPPGPSPANAEPAKK